MPPDQEIAGTLPPKSRDGTSCGGPPHDGPLLALAAALHQGRSLAERVRLVRFRRVRGAAAGADDDEVNDGNEHADGDDTFTDETAA